MLYPHNRLATEHAATKSPARAVYFTLNEPLDSWEHAAVSLRGGRRPDQPVEEPRHVRPGDPAAAASRPRAWLWARGLHREQRRESRRVSLPRCFASCSRHGGSRGRVPPHDEYLRGKKREEGVRLLALEVPAEKVVRLRATTLPAMIADLQGPASPSRAGYRGRLPLLRHPLVARLHVADRWRIPLAEQGFRLGRVEAHCQVEGLLRRG